MKLPLPKTIFIIPLLSGFLWPAISSGQCLCSGGVPANAEVHTARLDSVTLTTTIPMPLFPTATGTLVCVNLQSTISSVLTFDLVNQISDNFDYNMQTNLTGSVSGPGGLKTSTNSTQEYPIGELGPYMGGADTYHFGPETIFDNVSVQKTIDGDVSSYMGSGNVNLIYSLSGPVWADPTSGNYGLNVRTYSSVDVTLTYYWCETSVLAQSIRNFSVTQKDNLVDLKWQGDNDGSSNTYDIQISYDGKTFTTLKQAGNEDVVNGTSAEYEYQYRPDQSLNGKLYFRIKQTSGTAVKYSAVRIIGVGSEASSGLKIFPNPVTQQVNLDFHEFLSGDLLVEISNRLGQPVYRNNIPVNNASVLQLRLKDPPPAGIYFLRVRNASTGKMYSGKLLFTK